MGVALRLLSGGTGVKVIEWGLLVVEWDGALCLIVERGGVYRIVVVVGDLYHCSC